MRLVSHETDPGVIIFHVYWVLSRLQLAPTSCLPKGPTNDHFKIFSCKFDLLPLTLEIYPEISDVAKNRNFLPAG